MATVKPFMCIRPSEKAASQVAALPYDVYSREEAKREVEKNPLSFLRIDRAETQFPDTVGLYEPCVYEKAGELLEEMIKEGIFVTEEEPCYYLYELTMGRHVQTGIVACSSVDDYIKGVIKKHENTRADKEMDRIRHVDVTGAQTGPIFLAYREKKELSQLMREEKQNPSLYDFTSPDGIRHRVFKISDTGKIRQITNNFHEIPCAYIADGHHRAASAVKVAIKRREEHPEYTGEEEFNYFLSVLFPAEELEILPYNRVVKDLNGLTKEEFLEALSQKFTISGGRKQAVRPEEKGLFGLYLPGEWYELRAKKETASEDPVKGLDVSVLQEFCLAPVLGIEDPRTDKRIEFIGGIRGTRELERRVEEDMAAAFSMYPTSMEELLSVADAGLLMPPKSTWFEPKLRSGLFIHRI